jgi:hypothetical protein
MKSGNGSFFPPRTVTDFLAAQFRVLPCLERLFNRRRSFRQDLVSS